MYHVFVDVEKAFAKVPRKVVRWALLRQRALAMLINVMMALCVGIRSRV